MKCEMCGQTLPTPTFPTPTYKVGDKVRIAFGGSLDFDEIGVVVEIRSGTHSSATKYVHVILLTGRRVGERTVWADPYSLEVVHGFLHIDSSGFGDTYRLYEKHRF